MDFLFEVGLEEVPARMIASAQAELLRRTIALLERERLLSGANAEPVSYSTPRRLAVYVPVVLDRQAELSEDLLGPAVKIAYKDGVPGPAAIAFAKKAGVAVEDLRTVTTPKGDYIAATSIKQGRSAAEVLAAELPKELAQIYWAKTMSWRAGKPERFVRPVRWIAALLGQQVIPVEFGGFTAGRVTYGHRILFGAQPISLAKPTDFAEALTNAHVMADVEQRRHTIRKALDRVCRTAEGMRWREDHALVDKMTHLTEWPSVVLGRFDPEFLTLPEEVLVTVMRDHQNYFAVEDSQGKLAPYFLAVLNTAPTPAAEPIIRHGNERVLRARFNDARFFWEFDQRTPLNDRVPLLEHVTFQKDLGSYAAKSLRVAEVARSLGWTARERGFPVDEAALEDAARLAKADLTTELVKEFTELQGEVGGLYARAQGVSEPAAAAIYDHYRPTSMEDRIPRTPEGQILAIADKVDTIAGMFSLGLEPTGSKDPFALRRAANGIVKILAESNVPLTLPQVIAASGAAGDVAAKVSAFFAERLDFYLRDVCGQAYDVVKAVLAVGADDVRDAVARAEAVTAVRGSADFEAVSAALKRTRNILAQATEKGIEFGDRLDGLSSIPPTEEALIAKTRTVQQQVAAERQAGNDRAALEAIASIRPEIDRFFETVMVMDPDERIRHMRLTLLNWILQGFSGIADFSEIITAG